MTKSGRPNVPIKAVKRTIKLTNDLDKSEILKQEWVMIDCEVQEELEDNYSNMQRQKLTDHALYHKNGAAMYTVLYGQIHADIITIAKRSVSPDFMTVQKDSDVVGLLKILRSICVQNLTGSKVDPYSEHLKILSSTLSYAQKKGESNNKFGDAVNDQVPTAQSRCGVFVFGEHYHIKVLNDGGLSDLKDYFSLDQDGKDKYDELARQLICARLIINNSLSAKTHTFLKEQYVVNQSNYPNNVIEAVAMITSFGNDDITGRGNNNKNTNKISKAIVSIHLADCGDDCSNDDDGSVVSFESIENDQGTNDDNDLPAVLAPVVNSEFGNDNIDKIVETNDDGDDGDNNDNNDTTPTSGNNDEEIPNEDHSEPNSDDTIPNNNDTDSSTPTNEAHAWSLLVVADDDDDAGDYDEFRSDYDLDYDGVFDNDDAGEGEEYCCMTVTDSWDPHVDDEYEDDDILLRHGIFDTGGNPSIHPNFFHGTLNNSICRPYTNNDPISATNVLHRALLKSSMRIKRSDVNNSIKHYDTLQCKFQRIRIHNSTNYLRLNSSESLQLLLLSHGLPLLYPSTIESINLELIFASQIQQAGFSGNMIEEICNIDTDLYNEELDTNGNVNLVQICLQLTNLQQKRFLNKWTNVMMRKLTRAGIKHPSELKDYIINETLNPRLINAGNSGFHQTTQQGFLDLINGNQDFC